MLTYIRLINQKGDINMKTKKKIILCLSIIAFSLIIIVILIPRHHKSHSTVHYRLGSLTMEGKSIVIPFITELRVGTWIAKYKNGQIGEELTYSLGSPDNYKRYYPSGRIKTTAQFKNGYCYGKLTNYRDDGSISHLAEYPGTKEGKVIESIYYDKHGKIIVHIKNGKTIIDNSKLKADVIEKIRRDRHRLENLRTTARLKR